MRRVLAPQLAVGAWLQRRDSERRLEADHGQGLIGQKGLGPKRAPETHPKLLQSNEFLRSVAFRRFPKAHGFPARLPNYRILIFSRTHANHPLLAKVSWAR